MTASLGRLWAVASLTVKEAVRRRAFFALILFAVALLSSMTFFSSVDPVSKLRLIEVWSNRATIFFAAIAAIFLGASSLPSDYEQKRIYVLASKPIHKVNFFLGKYVGFLIVVAIFLLVMGSISVAYMRIVKLAGGPMIPELRARPRAWPDAFEGIDGVEKNPQSPDVLGITSNPPGTIVLAFSPLDPAALGDPVELRGEVRVRSRLPGRDRGAIQVEIRGQDVPFSQAVPVRNGERFALAIPSSVTASRRPLEVRLSPATSDALVAFADVAFHGARGTARPGAAGTEGRVDTRTGETIGSAPGVLRWTFASLDPSDFPETVSLRLLLVVSGIRNVYRFSGPVHVLVESGGATHETDVTVQSNEWAAVHFPRRLLEARKPVHVYVVPGDADTRIRGHRERLVLFEADESFEWNYLKGLALTFCWIALLMTVALMFSSFLSAPVSMMMAIVVFIVGVLHDFTGEGVRDIDRSLAQAKEAEQHGRKAKTPEDLPPWLLKITNTIAKGTLEVFPNATTFDFTRYLLNDLAVSGRDLRRAFLHMLPRVATVILIGMLVMMFKDFG